MTSSSIPYTVGNWVRGERFYGREELLAEVLSGQRQALWLLGTRRSGKTSLLRQVELLAAAAEPARWFPLFWDLQGADDEAGLHESWADALLDAEDRLEQIGVPAAAREETDVFASIAGLRRHLRGRGLTLLLLCDEVEELIALQQNEPKLLRKLRRTLQSPDDVQSVLASSIRLWALSEAREDTSPFLHGFTPPLYLHRLSEAAARALVRQDRLPPEARPRLADAVVATICERCDHHPYLLQLVAKRTVESGGDVEEACEQVASDQMVAHFFAVDVGMLSAAERRILSLLCERPAASSHGIVEGLAGGADAAEVHAALYRLGSLGLLRRDEGEWRVGNYFFRRWMREQDSRVSGGRTHASLSATQHLPAPLDSAVAVERVDDRYRVLERAGEGAHGVVFRAVDEMLEAVVALKLLRPEFAGSEDALARLRQEVLLSRDLGHPNVVRTYHLGHWRGRIYLTMQWVEGPTLAQLLRQRGALPLSEVVRIGSRLASALAAAHARKVLHRDLKPDNILMAGGSEPMVSDFGLARLIGEPGLTRTSLFVGTPSYASPEQARQEGLDERSDLYALGLLLFEMATGRMPFLADTAIGMLMHHSTTPPPDPRELRPEVPEPLARLVLACLAKQPGDRPDSADVVKQALSSVSSGVTAAPPAEKAG